jgi:predicted RNA-binding Zn-ribbon protein involved in translation (DUF1610 family)
MREPAKPVVTTWNCPACGGQIAIKSGATIHVACPYCGSIVDAKDPNHRLITEYDRKIKIQPRIPLGVRGEIRGEKYECIGFLRRRIMVEGTPYEWSEYLLWHPQRGYRWLSEYGHHWTYLKPCTGIPVRSGLEVKFLDRTYKKFQSAQATVTYALGEFNWAVTRGETSQATDYVAPPYILSEDKSSNESNWTLGEYIDIHEIWKAFALAGDVPVPQGVAAAQPSPYEAMAPALHKLFGLFAALVLVMQVVTCASSKNRQAHQETFVVLPVVQDPKDSAKEVDRTCVTKNFTLEGGTSNVEIRIDTNADNNWAYFECALLSPENEEVIEFTREVEYYHGVDDGESWSEGDRNDSVIIGTVPPGTWTLRLEPESPTQNLTFTVTVTRDVPRFVWFFWAVILLPIPYLIFLWRRRSFEYNRWLESDFPMRPLVQTNSDDDD